jgi:hypothetical protein
VQGCTNPRRQVCMPTTFSNVAPNTVFLKYITCFMSPFWRLEFSCGSYTFGKVDHPWGRDSSVDMRLATGRTVRGSIQGGCETFRTRPRRPWGPLSLLYNWYRVSFLGGKRPGRGVKHPPASSVEVKERVELQIYSLSGCSWPVLARYLPLPFAALD